MFALFHRLTEAEKDALLRDQQKLIGQMAARISELEALFGKPRTPSFNSSKPPSKDDFRGNRPRSGKGGKRPSREGKHRPLASDPDKTKRVTQATNITVEIVNKITGQNGFVVLPRRWVVERFFAWINRNRRLAKDVEPTLKSAAAFLYAAAAMLIIRRLARPA